MWCWRRLLRVPWTASRSNQLILKEIILEYSLERLMLQLKLQSFGHLMQRTDSLEKTDAGQDCRQEEKGTTDDEMVGWHHWFNGHELGKLWEMVRDRETWHAAVHGVAGHGVDTNWQLNNNNIVCLSLSLAARIMDIFHPFPIYLTFSYKAWISSVFSELHKYFFDIPQAPKSIFCKDHHCSLFYIIDLFKFYLWLSNLGKIRNKECKCKSYRVFFNRVLHFSPQGRIKEKSCGHVCIRY